MLGSIIQTQPQGPLIGFVFDDTIGDLLGFNETTLWEEYYLSSNPVDILSFDNNFIHTDIAQGWFLKVNDLEKFKILLWTLILVINIFRKSEVDYSGI